FLFALILTGHRTPMITATMAQFVSETGTEWNLMRSVISSRMTKANPYLYLGREEANNYVSKLFQVEKDTTISILNTARPNVVLVIIESFTADLTSTLGGTKDITPNFDRLINKGVLFSNIYAAGNRTDKGLIGTLAGFPTLATGSIVKWPEKMQKIPAISQSLFNNGYRTSFYYGGESEFDNYKAFILSHNYQRLVDRNNFEENNGTSWGQYDEATFERQVKDLNNEAQPFFSTLLTLTNHEPYGLPGKYKFGKSDNVAKFKSTAYYTDSCINAYLNNAKKTDWYKNTLFVFIADHGHLLPKNSHDIFEPQRYHIPLLFYGEVIKDEYRGRKMPQTGSQNDVVATILGQLNISAKEYIWSKNLLNPYVKPFAFFSWDNGMGFINNKQCVTFDNVGKTVLYNSNARDTSQTEELLNNAKSYLQNVYQQFIEF
ncbi:MAG: LTA synthase family protein, partial [Pedobacter sp.]